MTVNVLGSVLSSLLLDKNGLATLVDAVLNQSLDEQVGCRALCAIWRYADESYRGALWRILFEIDRQPTGLKHSCFDQLAVTAMHQGSLLVPTIVKDDCRSLTADDDGHWLEQNENDEEPF